MTRLLLSLLLCSTVVGCAAGSPAMRPRAADVMDEADRRVVRSACAGDTCLHYAEQRPKN